MSTNSFYNVNREKRMIKVLLCFKKFLTTQKILCEQKNYRIFESLLCKHLYFELNYNININKVLDFQFE